MLLREVTTLNGELRPSKFKPVFVSRWSVQNHTFYPAHYFNGGIPMRPNHRYMLCITPADGTFNVYRIYDV